MSEADEFDQIDAYAEAEMDPFPDDGDLSPLEIASREHAAKELWRLGRLESEAAQVEAVYAARLAPLDAYRADRLGGISRRREWIRRGLELFMRSVADRDRIKSLTLPEGVLELSKARTRVEGDVELVPEDLKPFLIRWKAELNKVAAKDTLTPGPVIGDEQTDGTIKRAAVGADGAVVPGVWFVCDDQPSFSVQLTREDTFDA